MEDHGESGDTFWLQVKDKDGIVVAELSLPEEASVNVVSITTGNIVVPAGKVRSADSGAESPSDDPNDSIQETPVEETLAKETPVIEDKATGDDVSEHMIFLPFVQR